MMKKEKYKENYTKYSINYIEGDDLKNIDLDYALFVLLLDNVEGQKQYLKKYSKNGVLQELVSIHQFDNQTIMMKHNCKDLVSIPIDFEKTYENMYKYLNI